MTVIEKDKARGGTTTPKHSMTKILVVSLALAVGSLGIVVSVI